MAVLKKKEVFGNFFVAECLESIGADYESKSSMTIMLETQILIVVLF